jgi:hypothetical protein
MRAIVKGIVTERFWNVLVKLRKRHLDSRCAVDVRNKVPHKQKPEALMLNRPFSILVYWGTSATTCLSVRAPGDE